MVRRSSRSRSRGRPDLYQAGEVKTPPEKKKVAAPKAELEVKKMLFEVGESVMSRWPGSKLYYNSKVQLVREEENEYDVEFENGIVFTVGAKDIYRPTSGALRKAVTSRKSKSKSRAHSTGRGRKARPVSINQSSEEEETVNTSNTNKSVGFEDPPHFDRELSVGKDKKVSQSSAKLSSSSKQSKKGSNSSRVSKKASASSQASGSSKIQNEILNSDLTEDEDVPVTKASNSSRKSNRISASSAKISTRLRRSAKAAEENEIEDVSSEEGEPPVTRSRRSASSKTLEKISSSSKKSAQAVKESADDLSDEDDEPPVTRSRRSASSKIVENGDPNIDHNAVSLSSAPITDVFSDDEELLSVSQRPSSSSKISKKLSISSRLSNLLGGKSDDGGSSPASRSSVVSKKMSFTKRISQIVGGVTTHEETVNIEINQPSESSEVSKKVSISSRKSGRASKSSRAENIEFSDDAEPDEDEEEIVVTPRRSSRISAKISNSTNISAKSPVSAANTSRLDEYSEDELEGKANATVGHDELVSSSSSWSFDWVWAILFMCLCPSILITLHTICTGNVCNLAMPRISTNPVDYFDKDAMILVVGFSAVLRICEFLCLGTNVEGYRMNGFQTLILSLIAVPVMVTHEISLGLVFLKYFHLMSSCIILSFLQSIISYILSRWASPETLSQKGSTGNPIVDLYHGRELNPTFLGCNMKLQTFRFSMISLALLNVVMVTDSALSSSGKVNPAVVIAASLQVLYAMDAMFYEEYYFYSHDYLNSGYGWSMISSYLTFPFLPTLITRYMIYRLPEVEWYYLALIALLNLLGYIIYRSSENQRCELAKNPNNPKLSNLKVLETIPNRKLIVSSWWGLVRHPAYLGELLIQWSWVLPAVGTLGVTDLVPYYLPVVTTLMLVIRCIQINRRNKRKYGDAWNEYCGRVRANIVPLVF